MRALIVLFALVATPFVAGVSQVGAKCDNGKSDGHRSAQGTASAHKGSCQPQGPPSPPPVLDADQDGVPDGLDSCPNTALGTAVDPSGCALPSTPPPPPPPPPATPPPTTGGGCANSPGTGDGAVAGQLFIDDQAQNFPYLAGWCVEVRDLSGAVIATTVTSGVALDLDGSNFIVTGVPAGTYTVCEVLPANTSLHQTFPTSGPDCGGGVIGKTTMVVAGGTSGFIYFGNLP